MYLHTLSTFLFLLQPQLKAGIFFVHFEMHILKNALRNANAIRKL